jgi:hypothetical protein
MRLLVVKVEPGMGMAFGTLRHGSDQILIVMYTEIIAPLIAVPRAHSRLEESSDFLSESKIKAWFF